MAGGGGSGCNFLGKVSLVRVGEDPKTNPLPPPFPRSEEKKRKFWPGFALDLETLLDREKKETQKCERTHFFKMIF